MDAVQVQRLAEAIVSERSDLIAAYRDSKARGGSLLTKWIEAGCPPIAGAQPPVSQPVHPLGPPVVSGTQITVDLMLQQPTRITRMISDLSLQRFLVDRVFSNAGSVSGGAVVYDVAERNELYATRDVQKVEPGAEFPVIQAERFAPRVATVDKWGGKVWIPDEARDRNQTVTFTNKIRQLTNTIIRKINQIGIEVLNDAISEFSRTASGNDWTNIVTGGSAQSNATLWPAADFAHVDQTAEEDELGINYTLVILNPQEYAQLIVLYGASGLTQLLNAMNKTIYVTNRQPAGKAKFVAEGQVGEMRVEKPLSSETWRQPERQRTWVQSDVRPVMFVNNPFAILEVTGLAG